MEAEQHGEVDAGRQADPAAVIGPLDEDTVRGLRTLLTAKIVSMIVLIAVAVGAGVLLAPQLGSVLGFAGQVQATVTALDPLPASENTSPQCLRVHVRVAWAGHSGLFTGCAEGDAAGDAPTAVAVPGAGGQRAGVGDQVGVYALAPWQTVVVGDRWPNAVLALVLLAVILAAGLGIHRYRRERRDLAALCRAPRAAVPHPARRAGLSMAFDVLTMGSGPGGGRGRRAMVRVVFDDPALAPLRLQVASATQESMRWRDVTVYPTGETRRGAPSGPYVLVTERGIQVAAGRAIKRRGSRA